jgi:hypothetical protein
VPCLGILVVHPHDHQSLFSTEKTTMGDVANPSYGVHEMTRAAQASTVQPHDFIVPDQAIPHYVKNSNQIYRSETIVTQIRYTDRRRA